MQFRFTGFSITIRPIAVVLLPPGEKTYLEKITWTIQMHNEDVREKPVMPLLYQS